MREPSFVFPTELTELAQHFAAAGDTLYTVGGLPRNALLGLPPSDIDICSRLTPDETKALCAQAQVRCFMKAPQFGTVEIHMGAHQFEHTTFRGDTYGAGGTHRPEHVSFGASLEQDAFRRDFTCNALYIDVLNGTLIDPTGGVPDVQNRLIRASSPDPRRILQDDGLRVLRLVRFACELGFAVEPATFAAARACAPGLADIAWERKRDELSKILMSDMRYPAITAGMPSAVLRGLLMLYDLGALPYVIPELLEGEGVSQRPQYHAYDVLRHNLHACAAAQPNLVLRLSALLHDIGKPAALREKGLPIDAGSHAQTPEGLLPKGKTPMLGHDKLGEEIAREILERLRYPHALCAEVLFLIGHHMYDLSGHAKENTLRARFATFGYERALSLCDIREADVLGSGLCTTYTATRWRELLARMKHEGAPFSQAALCCTGQDIMRWLNLPPGPEVGIIKERLLRHCACHPQDNQPERLMRLVRGMAQKPVATKRG